MAGDEHAICGEGNWFNHKTLRAESLSVSHIGFEFMFSFRNGAGVSIVRILIDPGASRRALQCLKELIQKYERFVGPIRMTDAESLHEINEATPDEQW
jgi:hypothetical protein